MVSIPVRGQSGTILGLEVVPAADGSGNLVPVVHLDNPDIIVGEVDVTTTYHTVAPVINDGQTAPLQSDVRGNLKVNIAASEAGAINATFSGSLAAGSNTIGGTYAAPTASASFAIIPGSSSVLESSHILKAGPGNLYSLYVVTGSVGGFLMTFNSTTVPADGPVTPVECIPLSPHSLVAINAEGALPDHYSTGIVVVFSTTGPFTKTTSGVYGAGPYGAGPYGANPTTAFFKWCVQ